MEASSKLSKKQKTVIAFLSGSAGELDWILPIIERLSQKGLNIMIVFLTKHAQKSVDANQMLSDYIFYKNKNIRSFSLMAYCLKK